MISGYQAIDTTSEDMDVSGIDYSDVQFIGKSNDASDGLKNNLKLKNVF